jgi:hypothetical protein
VYTVPNSPTSSAEKQVAPTPARSSTRVRSRSAKAKLLDEEVLEDVDVGDEPSKVRGQSVKKALQFLHQRRCDCLNQV